MEKFKRNPLAASVMTGVTALLGGIEPAWAASDPPQTSSFSVTVSDNVTDNTSSSTSGNFFFTDTDPEPDPGAFLKFDTSGGRTLTQVLVEVITNTNLTSMQADVSGTCTDLSGSTQHCQASAQNNSVFSALVDFGFGTTLGLGADQTFSPGPMASAGCEFSSERSCQYLNSQSTSPLVTLFSSIFTSPADLALFIGSDFHVTPGLGLAGPWSASIVEPSFSEPVNAFEVSANTIWNGTINVTYTFDENGVGVPEPATLLLFGTGLAGLGLLRRKPKSSA